MSAITDPVTIANTLLTVSGSVAVSAITDPVTIANTLLTVGGSVEVSAIADPVTIANTLLTVGGTITIGGYTVVTDSKINEEVTGTEVIFPDKDISTFKQASIILYNGDADTPITLSLQISPTTADGDYIDSGEPIVIPANGSHYIPAISYAHYARLQCAMGSETAILNAYFIGQA